jgi:uncharacterized SAM-binding protein YcdF (DUF218 family)
MLSAHNSFMAKKAKATTAARVGAKKSQRRVGVWIWRGGALLCSAFGLVMFLLDGYGKTDRVQRAQAIVVLGARVQENGKPGSSLRARTEHAVALYRQGLAPLIIFTGGLGQNAPAESVAAAQFAQKMGVPPAAMVREETSKTTWQNIGNASEICRARGIASRRFLRPARASTRAPHSG